MITRHPPEDWLLAHAAGTLDEARDLLVAVHLLSCPQCRGLVAEAETLGGAALGASTPSDPAPDGLEQLLARLDAEPPVVEAPRSPPGRPGMPALVAPWADGTWSWLAPGTWGIDLPHATDGELPLRLIWMRAGTKLPHRHRGDEAAIVLSGGWTDQYGHVGPGDLHVTTDRDQHDQVIDRGEPCVALVLAERKTEAPWQWRWLSPLFRT